MGKRDVDVPHTCPTIDAVLESMEEIRGQNSELRELAEKYAEEADEWEDTAEELEKELDKAKDQISDLEAEIELLKSHT